MALDATVGGSDSDSYVTEAEFTTYIASIGYSVPSGGDQEQALRKATQYLDRAYRGKWKGFRTDRDQALAWPRTANSDLPVNFLTPSFTVGVIDEDGYEIATNVIPRQVKEAQYEAAMLILDGVDLLPRQERGNAIESERVKAGPVETETTYRSDASTRDRLLAIEGLLAGLAWGHPGASSGSGRLVRA